MPRRARPLRRRHVVPPRRPRSRDPPLPDPSDGTTGSPLSAVTAEIVAAWGLTLRLLPMSDDPVRTRITVRDPTEPASCACRSGSCASAPQPPVVVGPLRRCRRGGPGAGRARSARCGRCDRALPVEPRDLDRADPCGARHPRRARRAPRPGRRDLTDRRRRAGTRSGRPAHGPLGIDVSCVGVARDLRAVLLDARDRRASMPRASPRSKPRVCTRSSPTR